MNYREKTKLVRAAIIESHTDQPGHFIDRIQETLNDTEDDDGIGPELDSFNPDLLSANLSEKFSGEVCVSWCDSIDDIINNYNKLFDLFSPK